ncbi:MAG: O-methyltransferase [Candidatus Brocadia sp.]
MLNKALFLTNNQSDTFDFVFIDADKVNYDGYYERALELLRPGGLIPSTMSSGLEWLQIRKLWIKTPLRFGPSTKKLHQDNRIELSPVPIGDGLALALKRLRDTFVA